MYNNLFYFSIASQPTFLSASFGRTDSPISLKRIEIEDILSGLPEKRHQIVIGFEILTDNFHAIQNQAETVSKQNNKLFKYYADSIM